jgi:hypothetical protein
MRDEKPLASMDAAAAASRDPDPRRWKALALLCVANFMVILDAQIVILALRRSRGSYASRPGTGSGC